MQLEAIVARTRNAALPSDEQATLKAAVDTLTRLTEESETTTTTQERGRSLIFGPRTATKDSVLGKGKPAGGAWCNRHRRGAAARQENAHWPWS
ncbi:hypothetical protein [uncultured Thiodictyon sp.]|uniref:hypothetical protein n=1 Tax=uncultured Thiodictyon sp. TaxID=1846217 RepID=UPI0025D68379|nr:hypothetical protein [uncultured Thiodictyon sp.]